MCPRYPHAVHGAGARSALPVANHVYPLSTPTPLQFQTTQRAIRSPIRAADRPLMIKWRWFARVSLLATPEPARAARWPTLSDVTDWTVTAPLSRAGWWRSRDDRQRRRLLQISRLVWTVCKDRTVTRSKVAKYIDLVVFTKLRLKLKSHRFVIIQLSRIGIKMLDYLILASFACSTTISVLQSVTVSRS